MAECISGSGLVQDEDVLETRRRCCSIARRLVPSCAQSYYSPCGLTDSAVEDCNKVLWCVGLQIRNCVSNDRGVNIRDTRVKVVVARKLRSGFLRQHLQSESGLVALALLCILFNKHRCLIVLELFDVIAKDRDVLVALEMIPALKRLIIVVDPDEGPFGVEVMVEYLKRVVVDAGLELRFIDGVYRLNVKTSLVLALLNQREVRLTALDLTGLSVEAAVAETIVFALAKNTSLTDLAVGSHIFASGHECKSSEHFAWYLMQKKALITRLHLDAYDMNEECDSWELLRALVRAICDMTSLQELTARWLCRAADIGLFGRVLASKGGLRFLDVRCRPCCDQGAHQPHLRTFGANVMESWYSSLKNNYCLQQQLTIDLSLCTLEECRLFVNVVANYPLDNVTVLNVAGDGCLQALYETIRQHDLLHRVIVEDHHVGPADMKVLWSYPEARVITLSSSHFPDLPALCAAIEELAMCRDITSLRLRFDSYDESLYSAAADLMEVLATTVREMELYVKNFHEEEDGSRVACQNRLIKCVASNRNFTRVKLHVEYLNATCCQFVADSVLDSWTLCELSLEVLESPSCAMLLSCLCPGVTRNYSLLVVTLPENGVKMELEMATLQDVTRRNTHFLELASRFVILRHGSDTCGRDVLPLVAKHPKLVENVARETWVTETEAKSMIEDALQSIAPCPST
ncbi:hypothetical protein MTO96_026450 [Rhipicephalus appendiculatus]